MLLHRFVKAFHLRFAFAFNAQGNKNPPSSSSGTSPFSIRE
jgi:hypothetical protein